LLAYFGQTFEPPCGRCDACDAGLVERDERADAFPPGAEVEHAEWGPGIVLRSSGDRLVVQFASVGYRTLDVVLVEERGLLRLAS
jgi:ATP-dependent DNA helicase RecQ